jgi:hypothetical protein
MTGQFSASEHLIGYLYQIRYALFILLKKIRTEPGIELAIEQRDDVEFDREGEPAELLQLKHHISRRASLTDSSSDLWKTIRIWSTHLAENPNQFSDIVLTLITTSKAPDSTIASKLRRDSNRNEADALDGLIRIATTSDSQTNRPAYNAFLELSDTQKNLLVSKIFIIDNSPNISDVETKLNQEALLLSRFPDSLRTRLEGWWFKRVIDALMINSFNTIKGIELQQKIYDLQDELRRDNLPNDFPELVEMDESELSESERIFVHQLRLILMGQTRLRIAIGDYYRAFQQRTKWLNEGLLFPGELERYENYLIGEWRRQFEIMREDMGDASPNQERMAELGKHLFRWIETANFTPIRPSYVDSYLSRGSYHILANRLKVGWHPEFIDRLGHLIEQAANQVS